MFCNKASESVSIKGFLIQNSMLRCEEMFPSQRNQSVFCSLIRENFDQTIFGKYAKPYIYNWVWSIIIDFHQTDSEIFGGFEILQRIFIPRLAITLDWSSISFVQCKKGRYLGNR